jgi:hypothetical protein
MLQKNEIHNVAFYYLYIIIGKQGLCMVAEGAEEGGLNCN